MTQTMVTLDRHVTPLGALLIKELESRQWTLRELGRNAGVTQATISKLINTPGRCPDLGTLNSLSAALSIPLYILIEACGYDVGITEKAA